MPFQAASALRGSYHPYPDSRARLIIRELAHIQVPSPAANTAMSPYLRASCASGDIAQCVIGKIKTGHCDFQNQPLGSETGQYPPAGTGPYCLKRDQTS
jgi:hypothetical protein